jgi:hypothetical protein
MKSLALAFGKPKSKGLILMDYQMPSSLQFIQA